MDIQYDEKTKKLLIALLLFVSCVISAIMLIYAPEPTNRKLRSFAHADSLILQTFDEFNIPSSQVRITVIRVDSNLTRKRYRVELPPGFQKTMLHAELNRTFNGLPVETPASVILPERDMKIQLTYEGTVFRTVDLRTDPDLTLQRNYASLMVAFDSTPSQPLLNEVVTLGEPIPFVLRVSNAREMREVEKEMRRYYSRTCFWLTNNSEATPEETSNNDNPFPPLYHLREIQPQARILSFNDLSAAGSSSSRSAVKIASDKNITFVDASNALILDSDLGETVFKQELSKFEQQAINGTHPVAIVMADERALDWLREKLNELKRRGLYLTEPPEITF